MAEISKESVLAERKEKIDWITIAKGMGILLVILGHYGPTFWFSPDFFRVINIIYLFHMPLFVLLSGCLYHFTLPNQSFISAYVSQWKKSFIRIFIPFFSLNFLYILLKLAGKFWFPYGEMPWENYALIFWNTKAFLPADLSWFLYVLFVFMTVYPLLLFCFRKPIWVLAFSFCIFALPVPPVLMLDRLTRFFFFFALGTCIQSYNKEIYIRFCRSSLSYPILSYPILSYPILSYPI